MGVPRRSALRADRVGDDSGGAVPRRDHHGAARRIRQSAVGRRDRSRHHRRCDRHHGGEHLPPSRAPRAGARPPSRDERLDRQAAPHPDRRGRGRQGDLLLGDHHHRGVPAAVHHAGRGGPDLRPDVAHLCVCAARRGDRDLHGDAGAVVDPAARAGEGGRDLPGAADPQGLSASCCRSPCAAIASRRRSRSRSSRSAACSARGSAPSSCPSSKKAICGSARCCRRPSRSKPAWTRVARMRNIIKSYPPVRTVVSEQGRGEDGTDPDGSFVAEFFVPLKPFDEWPKGLTKEELVKQMSEQLKREFVGVDFNFSQYIQDNIEEAVSGVKGENSVKIFGRDLAELERLSKAVKTEIGEVPGVTDPGVVQPARPAQSRGPHRPRQGRALRLLGRRHQRGGAGGDRRPGGDPGLRGRDEFRAHRPASRRNIAAMSTPSARSRSRCRTTIRRRRPPISRSATSAR